MIFQHTIDDVLSGRKTQTRSVVLENHTDDKTMAYDAMEWPDLHCVMPPKCISAVYTGNVTGTLRLKWAVGKTYAVQSGRGKKQVARIHITGIRQEHLQEISEEDAIAEGIEPIVCEWCGGYGIVQVMDCNYHPDTGEYMEWETTGQCPHCQGCCIVAPAIYGYEGLWDTTHTKPGTRWDDNPLVWVLDFELVTDD